MFNKIKENLFLIASAIFLIFSLTITMNLHAQTSGGCESCGGDMYGDNECYAVTTGANNCVDYGYSCYNEGSCENGEPVLE